MAAYQQRNIAALFAFTLFRDDYVDPRGKFNACHNRFSSRNTDTFEADKTRMQGIIRVLFASINLNDFISIHMTLITYSHIYMIIFISSILISKMSIA